MRATLIPTTKFARKAAGIIADKKGECSLSIIEDISMIKSTIKAATPACIPFNTAVTTALVIKSV